MKKSVPLFLLFLGLLGCSGSRKIYNGSASETILHYKKEKGWDNGFIFYSAIPGSVETWTYKGDSILLESYFNKKLKERKSFLTETIVNEQQMALFEKDLANCECLHCESIFYWYSIGDSTVQLSFPTSSPCIDKTTSFNSEIGQDFKTIISLYYTFEPIE